MHLLADTADIPAPGKAPPPKQARATPAGLRRLATGDAQLARALDKVGKVIGRDLAILVSGETGTGKEWLARAIHADSPRADRPFVAVNCAAIPETLIESELFGYEEGAFTGARRKGAPGRILQAHGATLFLDEIGDMPLALQARLLRVLQERVVTPLGGGRAIPVDLQLVCATNHDLRRRIGAGLFREDLYYRLNGLVVKLPPLRERSDLEALAHAILKAEGGGSLRIGGEVLALFRRHRWPGNLRQLASLLRLAAIMAEDEDEIGLRHLPDDVLDEADDPVDTPSPLPSASRAGAKLEAMEKAAILQALAANDGNLSAAAAGRAAARTPGR